MENIENMNEGIKNVVNEVAAANNPGPGNGVGIVIGVGVTLAIAAGGFLIKMAYDAFTGGKDNGKSDPETEDANENMDETTTK